MRNKRFQNNTGAAPVGKGAPRNFFDSGKKFQSNLRPGDSFIFEDSFRPKRSYPFLTPVQALRKFLGEKEEKVKPLQKETETTFPVECVNFCICDCCAVIIRVIH